MPLVHFYFSLPSSVGHTLLTRKCAFFRSSLFGTSVCSRLFRVKHATHTHTLCRETQNRKNHCLLQVLFFETCRCVWVYIDLFPALQHLCISWICVSAVLFALQTSPTNLLRVFCVVSASSRRLGSFFSELLANPFTYFIPLLASLYKAVDSGMLC